MTLVQRSCRILINGSLRRALDGVHHMSMAATKERWTAEMLRALPDDGRRYEIVHGELLVPPSPSFTHQRAVRQLLILIDAYLARVGRAEVMHAPADVELNPDSIVQPDLFVFPRVPGGKVRCFADVGELLLAIEVISPSTARYDRVVKRRLYLERDVAEYWIIDCDARCVERWRPGDERPAVVADILEWTGIDGAPPLVIELAAYFAEVLEEAAE